MNLHQAFTIFNEYNRRFDVSDGDDDDTVDDESQDDDQDHPLPPTEVNQDILDVIVMLGSILPSIQAKKKEKKRKVQIDPRIPRRALPSPEFSPWVHICASNCDNAMICFTGFNYALFNYLSVMFEEMYSKYTPYSRSGFIV